VSIATGCVVGLVTCRETVQSPLPPSPATGSSSPSPSSYETSLRSSGRRCSARRLRMVSGELPARSPRWRSFGAFSVRHSSLTDASRLPSRSPESGSSVSVRQLAREDPGHLARSMRVRTRGSFTASRANGPVNLGSACSCSRRPRTRLGRAAVLANDACSRGKLNPRVRASRDLTALSARTCLSAQLTR
jgi:hypothetical protein